MKSREIATILANRGMERGTLFVLETLCEQVNSQQKAITELALMQGKIIDALQNVVTGATGMKQQFEKAMGERSVQAVDDPEIDDKLN